MRRQIKAFVDQGEDRSRRFRRMAGHPLAGGANRGFSRTAIEDDDRGGAN